MSSDAPFPILDNPRDTAYSPIDQHDYSASRIPAFAEDLTDSQILHRHSSTAESIHDHTSRMKGYLEGFDSTMAPSNT
jgi:hypothetical protein